MGWNKMRKIDLSELSLSLSLSNVIQTFLCVSASMNNNNGQMDFIIISLVFGIISKQIVKTPYSFVELTARVRCLYLQTQVITSDVVFNVDICRTGDHSQGSGQSRPW